MNKSINDFLAEVLKPIVTEAVNDAFNARQEKKPLPAYLSVEALSELTGYSKQTIYQRNCDKLIPGACKIGGKLAFRTETILDWIEAGKVRATGLTRKDLKDGK